LRDERESAAVLERARLSSEHLDLDRAIIADTLFTIRGQARRYEPMPFDSKTFEWLD
jgi:hypothetical protein